MLEKYPVTTDRQKYRVTITSFESVYENYYKATVYVRRKSKLFKFNKWIKVYYTNKEKYHVDNTENGFVELVKTAVNNYEKWLIEQEKINLKFEKNKEQFSQWDGDMRSNKEG